MRWRNLIGRVAMIESLDLCSKTRAATIPRCCADIGRNSQLTALEFVRAQKQNFNSASYDDRLLTQRRAFFGIAEWSRGQVDLPAGIKFIDENGGGIVPMLSTT